MLIDETISFSRASMAGAKKSAFSVSSRYSSQPDEFDHVAIAHSRSGSRARSVGMPRNDRRRLFRNRDYFNR